MDFVSVQVVNLYSCTDTATDWKSVDITFSRCDIATMVSELDY